MVPLGSHMQQTTGRLTAKRGALVGAAMSLLLLLCIAGAAWTVYWSLRFGLTPRRPLSALETLVRFLIVMLALLFWKFHRERTARLALACTVVAAGSSGLFGLGLNSTGLQIVRLLFHFLAYCLGAAAISEWFLAKRNQARRLSAP